LYRHAEFAGNTGRKGRFAETGRTIEKNVSERFFAFLSRSDGNFKSAGNVTLSDHFGHPLRTERTILFRRQIMEQKNRLRLMQCVLGREDCFPGHA